MKTIKKNGKIIKTTARDVDRFRNFDIINNTFVKNKNLIPFSEIDKYLDEIGLDFFRKECKKNLKKIWEILNNLENILTRSLDGHEKDIQDYRKNRRVYAYYLSLNCIILNCLKKIKNVKDPYFEIFNLIRDCGHLYCSRKIPKTFEEFDYNLLNIVPIYLALKWYIEDKKILLNEDLQKKIDLYEEILEKRDYE